MIAERTATRRQPSLALVLVAVLVVALTGAASAVDVWRIGVVVSSSAGSALGAQQAQLARVSALALADGGVFGAPFEVLLRDDGGDPRRAEALATELVAEGALALVCCTTVAASERVALLAERVGVPLLALDGATAAGTWTYAMRADARTQLTAMAVDAGDAGRFSLALMAPDNAFGDAAAAAFERAMADTARTVAVEVRYDAGARVLTPEALLAATRQPGAIVIWGGSDDTALALDGLRRRGWFGQTYVRPEALAATAWSRLAIGGLAAASTPSGSDPWGGVSSVLAPVSMAESLPLEHPNRAAALASLGRIEAAVGAVPPLRRAELAVVDDALQLLHHAFEQVAALGLGAGLDAARVRQAVLDAVASASAKPLAAGTYQARAGDVRLARWQGLVPVSTR